MGMHVDMGLHVAGFQLQFQWRHHTQDVHRACTRTDVETMDAGGRETALESGTVPMQGQ